MRGSLGLAATARTVAPVPGRSDLVQVAPPSPEVKSPEGPAAYRIATPCGENPRERPAELEASDFTPAGSERSNHCPCSRTETNSEPSAYKVRFMTGECGSTDTRSAGPGSVARFCQLLPQSWDSTTLWAPAC